MKTLVLLPLSAAILSFSGYRHSCFTSSPSLLINDSIIINHKLDGQVDEWPADRFSPENDAGVQYAFDNDGTNLFIALTISGARTQFKMMRTGMTMYIDPKGKKKDNDGVEFPVKNGNVDLSSQALATRSYRSNNGEQSGEQERKPDIKAIRKVLAMNLVELKIFGLSNQYPDGQQLLLPGSVNIAFNWDAADAMHIEYRVPLSMLGDIASLDKKDVSIGWKIHAFEMPKEQEGSSGEGSGDGNEGGGGAGRQYGGGGGGGGGHRYGGGGAGRSGGGQADREKMMAEQKFWTKYIITIPETKKAF